MIDTHLHILPNVDDGPETMEETLALARALVQEGIRAAVATPHYNDEFPQRPAAEIGMRVREVQQALNAHNIPLWLYAGHEALIKPGLVDDIREGRLATLNGSRYLLLELWNTSWVPETERVIFELQVAGFVPVIAHPERCRAIQQDFNRLGALVRQGVLAQVTAGSLTGRWGKTIQRCAEGLLKKGFVHCIASDAHGVRKRPIDVREGLRRAEQLIGKARLAGLIETWPAAIVGNETGRS